MPKFIGEKITVETTGTVKEPERFTWRETTYEIVEIVMNWQDWGFSAGAKKRDWMARRHRNYFRVRTDSGEVFEIYHDRGRTVPGEWFLCQQIDG